MARRDLLVVGTLALFLAGEASWAFDQEPSRRSRFVRCGEVFMLPLVKDADASRGKEAQVSVVGAADGEFKLRFDARGYHPLVWGIKPLPNGRVVINCNDGPLSKPFETDRIEVVPRVKDEGVAPRCPVDAVLEATEDGKVRLRIAAPGYDPFTWVLRASPEWQLTLAPASDTKGMTIECRRAIVHFGKSELKPGSIYFYGPILWVTTPR